MPIKLAIHPLAGCTLLVLVVAQATSAQAQYTAKEWPEGA